MGKKKDRTIVEAINIVLQNEKKPLTYREIYERIVQDNLYHFATKHRYISFN